ncbi:MAG: sodium/glutamate symporter [Pelagimonas sp.]|uniref:sodium/glutamate symporter n=1 Tax=Pelagimonas sp. TaxID=2073170 RepID=UPI003D6C5C71
MPPSSDAIEISAFAALTLGIMVFFLGAKLTDTFGFLRKYSIPEPVSGGLLAAVVALMVVYVTGREVAYDLAARDFLLVYFFTTIGLNARVSDLLRGGPILAVLLVLTIGYMVIQNLVGVAGAVMFGLEPQAGVLLGTASLIGGHGTAIAWGPTVQGDYGVPGAAELGIASATIGLIMASVVGGPIAKFLIDRHKLSAEGTGSGEDETGLPDVVPDVVSEIKDEDPERYEITQTLFMRSILWIHLSIIIGYTVNETLIELGLKLPLFVPCLMSAILVANVVPALFPKKTFYARSKATDLISQFSLSVFLSMSLMSMELWTLASSAGVLTVTMVLQAIAATAFIVLVVFRAMGKSYFAAVISSGFAGFTLGATPTAIANMTAVTNRYGPSPLAFIVLPLISAFFVDIANAVMIKWFLTMW